jgi:hypothetical protein
LRLLETVRIRIVIIGVDGLILLVVGHGGGSEPSRP